MGRKILMFLCIFVISLGVAFFSTKYARRLWQGTPENADGTQKLSQAPVSLPNIPFLNLTQQSGLKFQLANHLHPQRTLPELLAGGVCAFDFDNDGLCDLYFPNLAWPNQPAVPAHMGKLYRNVGGGKFEDVTEAYGLAIPFVGIGVCAGDYDNDGYLDLFVSGVGVHRLFRNVGGKQFVEVTQTVLPKQIDLPNVPPEAFWNWDGELPLGTSCTFVDYDLDGKLDLFICHYVLWNPKSDSAQENRPRDFSPKQFAATHCLLYRNIDGKKFVDVSQEAGVQVSSTLSGHAVPVASALGVIACDANEDGFPDLIVTNDGNPHFFFRNIGGGEGKRGFVEEGQRVNIATIENQMPVNARGIDFAEIRPQQFAAVVTSSFGQNTLLYRIEAIRERLPQFVDIGQRAGVADTGRYLPKYSPLFVDFDLDGRLDLMLTTSTAPQIYWNRGDQPLFHPLGQDQLGLQLSEVSSGRGCAFFDYDGDGDLDFVVVSNNREARLFRNDQNLNHHWLRLNLVGDGLTTNRSALGAKVTIEANGQTLTRYVTGSKGFLSQSELTITVGLGKLDKIDRVIVRWPNWEQSTEVFTQLAVDRTHQIKQGTGQK